MENNNIKNFGNRESWWTAISQFTPLAMMIRLYSFLVLCLDCGYFILYAFFAVFQAIFQVFRPPSMKPLGEEIAVVIGASRGVGKELSLQLGRLGTIVICIDINSVDNESTVKEIRVEGGQAYAYTCDVTNYEQVKRTINAIETEISPITMLFHCCGVPSPRSLTTNPPPIQCTINVSVVSHFLLLETILPKMKQRNYGHIVMLTSVAGLGGIKNQMPLTVSQFAVQGLFESVVEELRIAKYHKTINMTLVHVYPFIISDDLAADIRLRIPSYFGTIKAAKAAALIIEGVRRNSTEISIPKHLLWFSHLIRLMPRKATFMLRELLDTGVDFG